MPKIIQILLLLISANIAIYLNNETPIINRHL